ncbi:sensor histidine kinase [Vibrio casei]|uniref:histidine kinase n=1 Tax=Vibrio casei TaxID=673372 RepID=A0A368LIQ7_9VIBR|nr:HAMP domain-containing sensor histidine kinase [Vibrio casei]RCS70561.1 sensor histidine kinase [Vibrio casei]SJN27583.1 Sensor histidine kinase [Vibrio casei]
MARTTSIKRNLVNSISILFGVIIFAVYLSIDLSLDGWVEQQFDRALVNKANYLKSLVKVSGNTLEFDDAMMTSQQDDGDRHYYQLWFKDKTIKRSKTLDEYPDVDLLKLSLPLNTSQLLDVRLPNGEEGRASISYFLPESEQLLSEHEHPAYLTLYQSDDSFENMLILVDILLVVSFFVSIFVMRYIAVRIVGKGLKPLEYLNEEIKKIDLDQKQAMEIPEPKQRVEEIEPIREELNAFIKSNQVFLQNEKRLTGDIAHELKTPIAEIMSLSEVYIRYPNDARISETYKQDMLKIAHRMKKIVDNLLLLQRTSSSLIHIEQEEMDINDLIQDIVNELAFKFDSIESRVHIELANDMILADHFSMHTMLINLLDNALFYSPEGSIVQIVVKEQGDGLQLIVGNEVTVALSTEDREHILDPMYQADQSRTSNDRYGLGLSIVDNLCRLNGYKLSIDHSNSNRIEFTIGLIPASL